MERHPQGPSKDVFVEYKAKVDFLKKVLESRALSQNNESRISKKVQNNDAVDVAGGIRRRSLRSLSPPNVSQQPKFPSQILILNIIMCYFFVLFSGV